jgi:glutathione S-transferase
VTITFYYLSGSPFSWKVWLSLERKQIPYELRVLSANAGDLMAPEFLTINSRGKVPAIVDDGFALNESLAIVEYPCRQGQDVRAQCVRDLLARSKRSRHAQRRHVRGSF